MLMAMLMVILMVIQIKLVQCVMFILNGCPRRAYMDRDKGPVPDGPAIGGSQVQPAARFGANISKYFHSIWWHWHT